MGHSGGGEQLCDQLIYTCVALTGIRVFLL